MWVRRRAFVSMPEWLILVLAGRPTTGDDYSLLTCSDFACVEHAVTGSDGGTYDAIALRQWLRYCDTTRRNPEVVPGCPIDGVDFGAFKRRFLLPHRILRIRDRFWRAKRRTVPMMMRVLRDCDRRRLRSAGFRNAKVLHQSHCSAFVRV